MDPRLKTLNNGFLKDSVIIISQNDNIISDSDEHITNASSDFHVYSIRHYIDTETIVGPLLVCLPV